MSLIIPYILTAIGFVLLIKGADFFVDGCVSVARRSGIPSMVIGLTIVAFGTSAPEAAVSIAASLRKSAGIAVGNITGSNIFNLLMVCGISVIIRNMSIKKETLRRDYPVYMLAMVLLYVMCAFTGEAKLTISRVEGAVILALIAAYVYILVRAVLKNGTAGEADRAELSGLKTVLYIIFGIAAVVAGGEAVVNGASGIARQFGLSESVIGLTVVAIGTSLPELVTSIVAVHKGEADIALGNVIGSNIFNVLFVIGAAAAVRPITVDNNAMSDMLVCFLLSAVVLVFCSLPAHRLRRVHGIIMVSAYVVFFISVFIRQFSNI